MLNDIPSWLAETGTKTGAERLLRSRLRLRHLRLLLAIAEHGTLQRASEAIGATQPAASKLVAELEAIAGAPLFARAARGLRANAAGEALTRHARAVLAQLAEAGQELQALAEGGGGAVAAGAVTAPALERLVPAALMLRARHPRLRITIEVAGSGRLARGVAERRLDFAIARIPADLDPALFEYEPIGEEALCILCRTGHPLLARARPGVPELADQDWVLPLPGTLLRQRVERLFHDAGMAAPAPVLETASFDASFAAVAGSDALTVASRALARLYCPSRLLRILPWRRRFSLEPYGVIRPRGHVLSAAARLVLTAARHGTGPLGRGAEDE